MANDDKQRWVLATSTGTPIFSSTSSSTAMGSVTVAITSGYDFEKSTAEIERAVYAHIQAVRALGREQINTLEIAHALSLPQESVIAAINKLRSKGVRVAA